MLGVLVANCGRHSLLSRIVKQHVPRCHTFMQANGNLARTFGWRLANRLALSRNIPSARWNMKSHALLLGGGAIFLGLGARSMLWPREVHCDVNRLGTVWQKTLSPDEIKFDWRRLWFYLEPQKWELLFSIAAALIVALLNIRIPSLLGDLTNVLARYASAFISDPMAKGFLSDVRKPATNLLSLFFLQSMFTFAYIYMLSRVGERMAARIRQDLFKQIIIQDIEFFDANRTGELVNRLTIDVQDFKSSFKQFVSQGLRSATQMIGGAISLIFISPHMAIIALASVPAVITFMSYLAKRLRTLSKASQEQSERATSVCEEAISNIRTVRASACEYREVQLFTTETNKAAKTAQELGYGIAVFQGLTNFFLNSLVLTTLYMGGHLMYKECLSAGQLMAFLVASQGLQRSLSQASMLIGTMLRGLTAGTRVFEFLQIKPKVDLLQGYVVPEDRLLGEITFENVSFAYPARPDHLVLDNFNLTIQPGETVALVGASGSGKSTIAALLERFYEPSFGVIKLDGYRLCDISPQWLRTNVLGFIEQQPVLFAATILENIRYGRPNAAKEEVYAASEQSQAHEFVAKLPNGYETYVGERGAQISGGQRQRIAIARALLKNPKVLILDEATSALDATSEAEVQRALDSAVKERTTLVIAHRLSTIRNADLIVVIDDGKIVEAGKHKDLMTKGGHYYRLVRQQEKRQPAGEDQQNNKQGINVPDENAKRVNSVQG